MTILKEIARKRLERVAHARAAVSEESLRGRAADAAGPKSLADAINEKEGPAIIAEYKLASPSKGVIREGLTPEDAAQEYESGGAAALSVITEPDFFNGDGDFVARVKAVSTLPVLRKDFILTPYQVFESRALGADAILLIVALLEGDLLSRLMEEARGLKMDCLVEAHDHVELETAVAAGATLIGINNRDLKTFEVSLATTVRLMPLVPGGVTVVAESGIESKEHIRMLRRAGAKGFLIGEALMRAQSPGARLKELLDAG